MPNCIICPRRMNCVGMQFNLYLQMYVCPRDMYKIAYDYKTTMINPPVVGTSTEANT